MKCGKGRDLKFERVTGITAWKGMPGRMAFSTGTQPTCGDMAGKEAGKLTISFSFLPPISCWCFSFIETNQMPNGKETYLTEREQNKKWKMDAKEQREAILYRAPFTSS